MPTITSKNAGNWVDRGDPALPVMQRVLAHFLGGREDADGDAMEEHARAIQGMVAADATEVHIVGYLNEVLRQVGRDGEPLPHKRVTAIALWHIAKAAQVRDFAERVLSGEVPPNEPTGEPLGGWLAARLLSPSELAEHNASLREQGFTE